VGISEAKNPIAAVAASPTAFLFEFLEHSQERRTLIKEKPNAMTPARLHLTLGEEDVP
jgi:hypothetical protein